MKEKKVVHAHVAKFPHFATSCSLLQKAGGKWAAEASEEDEPGMLASAIVARYGALIKIEFRMQGGLFWKDVVVSYNYISEGMINANRML